MFHDALVFFAERWVIRMKKDKTQKKNGVTELERQGKNTKEEFADGVKKEEPATLDVGITSFLTAIIIIFVMMILTYGLTFIIPGGYISFGKWILSPILVLFGEDSGSLIAIIGLLIGLGGIFNCMDKFGVLRFLLDKIVDRLGNRKNILLGATTMFFMLLGSVAGTYEECVALVPVVVALAIRLGWDALTGLGMSILAAGCGFAAGICNPFTVGVAQELAGLPMFSGMWLRAINFGMIYILLMIFLLRHIKKVENSFLSAGGNTDHVVLAEKIQGEESLSSRNCERSLEQNENIPMQERNLQENKFKKIVVTFKDGVVSVLPGVLLILMANSIRFTMMEGNILEPILQTAIGIAGGLPRWSVILFIYGLVLFFNFFIPSGSAKAFLLMPLIIPTAQAFDISAQLCIMAFAFGDGFSNVFYPTNPVLLISLGLAKVGYGDWVKWSFKFQLLNLFLTSALLLVGLMIGYC